MTTPDAAQARGELARSVGRDLEEIFGSAARSATERPPRRASAARSLTARARKPGRAGIATLGAVAAAGFLGLALGAVLRPQASEFETKPMAPAPRAQPVRLEVAAPAPAAVSPKAVVEGFPFSPEPYVAPAAAAAAPPPAAAAAKPKPKPEPRAERAVERRKRAAEPAGPCGRRCTYAEVMAADRRLRNAYFQAVEAGVPSPILRDYRNRWARLRHRADDDPARVVAGYRSMAGDLSRMARDVS